MICGNEFAQSFLKDYFDNISGGEKVKFGFLLLEGQENIGKTSIIRQLAKDFLGSNFQSDFLYIADLSTYLGKKHTLKVQIDDKDQKIDIEGHGSFLDLGTREIIEWINKYPVGKYKILLLENIERMTGAAANAFLKTFEEPLDNVIIIATTSNRQKVLETIQSRAFLIRFELPTHEQVISCLKVSYPEISQQKLDLVISFSMNRIGFAKRLLTGMSDVNDANDMITFFERYVNLSMKPGNYHEKLTILTQVHKSGYLDMFMDALMFYYDKVKRHEDVRKIVEVKGLIDSNVGVENCLFNLVIG